jgi:hypothetical protein
MKTTEIASVLLALCAEDPPLRDAPDRALAHGSLAAKHAPPGLRIGIHRRSIPVFFCRLAT